MTVTLKLALIVITAIYMFLIIKSIRKKKMNVSFSLFWIVTGIILIISALVPNMIEYISNLIGFETPSNMLFCITIFVSFYLIFNLTTILSEENRKNTLLIQEVSLLKKQVKNLEQKVDNYTNNSNNVVKKDEEEKNKKSDI